MSSYQILCILCALALVTSVVSSRVHKLQETVAITAIALGMSLLLLLGGKKGLRRACLSVFCLRLREARFSSLAAQWHVRFFTLCRRIADPFKNTEASEVGDFNPRLCQHFIIDLYHRRTVILGRTYVGSTVTA